MTNDQDREQNNQASTDQVYGKVKKNPMHIPVINEKQK